MILSFRINELSEKLSQIHLAKHPLLPVGLSYTASTQSSFLAQIFQTTFVEQWGCHLNNLLLMFVPPFTPNNLIDFICLIKVASLATKK
jgi:hypothetical protein